MICSRLTAVAAADLAPWRWRFKAKCRLFPFMAYRQFEAPALIRLSAVSARIFASGSSFLLCKLYCNASDNVRSSTLTSSCRFQGRTEGLIPKLLPEGLVTSRLSRHWASVCSGFSKARALSAIAPSNYNSHEGLCGVMPAPTRLSAAARDVEKGEPPVAAEPAEEPAASARPRHERREHGSSAVNDEQVFPKNNIPLVFAALLLTMFLVSCFLPSLSRIS